jgi:hypothetical protein
MAIIIALLSLGLRASRQDDPNDIFLGVHEPILYAAAVIWLGLRLRYDLVKQTNVLENRLRHRPSDDRHEKLCPNLYHPSKLRRD